MDTCQALTQAPRRADTPFVHRPMRWLRLTLLAALTPGILGCAGIVEPAAPAPFPSAGTLARAPSRSSAERIDVSPLLATAVSLEGTRYQIGGSSPAAGFDCSGLVQYVFAAHAIRLPRTVADQFVAGRPVARARIAPGDLIFFSTTAPGATHVGIVLDQQRFIHAPDTGRAVRIERLDLPYWRARETGIRRVVVAAEE